jgi:excisionase family DNA binding protein
MSTNITVQRICEYCGNEFTARTTKTKYCSHQCNSRHYKLKAKGIKIEQSDAETHKRKTKDITVANAKEFLTVKDVSLLLDCSLRTAYRLVNDGTIGGVNLAQRLTRVSRREINKILEPKPKQKILPQPVRDVQISECYTIGEVQQHFNISQTGLQMLIKRHNIPKKRQGKFTYVPKATIHKLLT